MHDKQRKEDGYYFKNQNLMLKIIPTDISFKSKKKKEKLKILGKIEVT